MPASNPAVMAHNHILSVTQRQEMLQGKKKVNAYGKYCSYIVSANSSSQQIQKVSVVHGWSVELGD